MSLRVIFMGTPDFAAVALRALIDSPHRVVAAWTQPPRPAGRGHRLRHSPVHDLADAHGIPVHHPKSLRGADAQAAFIGACRKTGEGGDTAADIAADIAVVAAYGLILPKPVLDAPRLGCVNIHASLLPRWRGAAPIQRAILAGDPETGITIMRMDEGLDTGPVLCAEAIPLGTAPTCQELHDRLAVLGGRMIVYALNGLEAGTLDATPQPPDGATYARKLTRAEGRLDWREPARALERRVRAFSPWPGAWFEHDGMRIKVLDARVMGDIAGAAPGTLVDDRLTIACGQATLRLVRVQREGKQPQGAPEFLRGFPLLKGTQLEVAEGPLPYGESEE